MTVKELIIELLDMQQDLDIFVEVNGDEEYDFDVAERDKTFSSRRVLLKIEGVSVE